MSHFARVLGLPSYISIEAIRNRLIQTVAKGSQTEKEFLAKNLDNIVEQALIQQEDFSVLVMGQPERAGCFCPSNTLLRNIIESISDRYSLVIIDCEAGLEQIHRSVISKIDYLLIISDPSLRSIETAQNILASAKKFTSYQEIGIILNRVKDNQHDLLTQKIRSLDAQFLGFIPDDEKIVDLELSGAPLRDLDSKSKSSMAAKEIFMKILGA
jgi:CO dehydrogenase maturation factor